MSSPHPTLLGIAFEGRDRVMADADNSQRLQAKFDYDWHLIGGLSELCNQHGVAAEAVQQIADRAVNFACGVAAVAAHRLAEVAS